MSKPPPTFAELAQQRAQEWAATQAVAAKAQADLQAAILAMPDVKGAPSPDVPWSHPTLACRVCATNMFSVTRWVTVNGVRHRAEVVCLACRTLGTWDWNTKVWLEDVTGQAPTVAP